MSLCAPNCRDPVTAAWPAAVNRDARTASNVHRQGGEHLEGGDGELGPFYVSTGVGSTTSLIGLAVRGIIGLLIVFWPLMLGQKSGGGWHSWVWAIAIPWWILLALAGVGYLVAKAEERKRAQAARGSSGR